MSIRALIFDIGGVLVTIDWDTYQKEQQPPEPADYPYAYEQLNTELARFITELRPHYKIAILCNGDSREPMNRKFKLHEMVDIMFFSGEEGMAKPDPRFYEFALTQLDVQAEETIFVDDQTKNIDAARQLGIHAVQFQHTQQAITEVLALLKG